ncbi:MAG: hypothetical protein AB7Q17_10105 [Phycisphaerae bacterium]
MSRQRAPGKRTEAIRLGTTNALAVWLLLAAPARAQDARFLRPEAAEVTAAKPFLVRIERLVDGRPAASTWPAARVHWLFVRGSGFQLNRDAAPAVAGRGGAERRAGAAAADDAQSATELSIEQAGLAMIGLDLKPVVERVPRREFARFLRERTATSAELIDELQTATRVPGHEAPADADAVRVRRVESLKTHVRVVEAMEARGGESPAAGAGPSQRGPDLDRTGAARGAAPPEPAGVVMSKTGQAVEIRWMADPHALAVRSDVPVRVYVAGGRGVKLRATPDGGAAQELTTDVGGIARFKLSQAGVWRIECHHATPVKDDPDADWVLHSGTVTFEIAERGNGR